MDVKIFSEEEKLFIQKEFTYNNIRHKARLDDEKQAADCFTEIATISQSDLQNVSTKSIILAPFNSTKSQIQSVSNSIWKLMITKNWVLRLGAWVRDTDR